MMQAQVIIPRRNFLVRALGFTAAGAALSIPIVTVADAQARIDHHTKELEKAFRDAFAGLKVEVLGNDATPEDIWGSAGKYTPEMIRDGRTSSRSLMFFVSRPQDEGEIDFRDRSGTWNTYGGHRGAAPRGRA
jgi:hypothetical protein